jgi:hypothetical protein
MLSASGPLFEWEFNEGRDILQLIEIVVLLRMLSQRLSLSYERLPYFLPVRVAAGSLGKLHL